MKKEKRTIMERFLMTKSEKAKLERLAELKEMDKSKIIRELIEKALISEEELKEFSQLLRDKFNLDENGFAKITDGFGNVYIYQENGKGKLTITMEKDHSA